MGWVVRENKLTGKVEWINDATGEADSFPPQQRSADYWKSIGFNFGARPKKGEKCHKPSDSLLHDLNRAEDRKRAASKERRREKLMEIDRDLQTGKRKVDEDVSIGTPRFSVPTENGGVRIVREDKVSEAEKERIERQRDAEAAARNPAPVTAAGPDPERVGVFEINGATPENTIPAGPVKSTPEAWIGQWNPSYRNAERRFF